MLEKSQKITLLGLQWDHNWNCQEVWSSYLHFPKHSRWSIPGGGRFGHPPVLIGLYFKDENPVKNVGARYTNHSAKMCFDSFYVKLFWWSAFSAVCWSKCTSWNVLVNQQPTWKWSEEEKKRLAAFILFTLQIQFKFN